MTTRQAGPLLTIVLRAGMGLILFFNVETERPASPTPTTASPAGESAGGEGSAVAEGGVTAGPAGFREYPIGDVHEQHAMSIAAVWLPGVEMDGSSAGPGVIHLEADIRATQNNPHGFANEEFVPYMKVRYRIVPKGGGEAIHEGEMIPMVAGDGLHYGASLDMPGPGEYTLTYAIEPPSAGGLGRHSDPATGVAAWWEPFEVEFDWDYQGPKEAPVAG